MTLARSISGIVNGKVDVSALGDSVIAWQVFTPVESNQVTWSTEYYAFATSTPLSLGNTIMAAAQTAVPLQTGWVYTFTGGQFSGQSGQGINFVIANGTPTGVYSFGLAQQAMVNSVASLTPLNAMPVLFNEQATFVPEEAVSIFLSSCRVAGTVIPPPTEAALTFTLSSQNATARVGFNDATNEFYLISI